MNELLFGLLVIVVRLAMVAIPVAIVAFGTQRWIKQRATSEVPKRWPLRLAVVLGAVAALIVEVVLAGMAGFDVGVRPEHFLWAAPFALAAGGFVALAGVAGYGILSSGNWPTPLSIVGIVALPIVLVISEILLSDVVGSLEGDSTVARADRQRTELQDLCSAMTFRVDTVSVEYGGTDGVDKLTIDLTLTAPADASFDPDAFVTANQTAYVANTYDLHGKIDPGVSIALKANEPSTFRVAFEQRTAGDTLPHAGPWRATIWLTRDDGATLICPVSFEVPAPDAASRSTTAWG